MFVLNPQIVPSGGAILLSITNTASAGDTDMQIDRSADGGSTWINLYSGGFVQFFLDVGEKLPQALSTTTGYTYRVYSASAPAISAISGPITPACQLTLIPDMLTETWRRLIQSGVNSLVVPAGMKRPQVLFQMPLDSTPELPFITMNLDLLQQEEVPIGFSIPYEQPFMETLAASGVGVWTVQGLQSSRYSIHVLAKSFQERDFFESAIIGIIYGLQKTLAAGFQQLRFSYQVTGGAIEADEAQPGFYYSQIMMDMTHIGMVQISAQTGVLSGIGVTATASSTPNVTATISGSGVFVAT